MCDDFYLSPPLLSWEPAVESKQDFAEITCPSVGSVFSAVAAKFDACGLIRYLPRPSSMSQDQPTSIGSRFPRLIKSVNICQS